MARGEVSQNQAVRRPPVVPPCPYCHEPTVRILPGLQGSNEVFFVILLAVIFFPAAIVYYIWVRSMPYCLTCARRVSKKLWLA